MSGLVPSMRRLVWVQACISKVGCDGTFPCPGSVFDRWCVCIVRLLLLAPYAFRNHLRRGSSMRQCTYNTIVTTLHQYGRGALSFLLWCFVHDKDPRSCGPVCRRWRSASGPSLAGLAGKGAWQGLFAAVRRRGDDLLNWHGRVSHVRSFDTTSSCLFCPAWYPLVIIAGSFS